MPNPHAADLRVEQGELLPCPFCGGEASDTGHIKYSKPLTDAWWADGTSIAEAFFVNCIKCGAVSRSGIAAGYQTKSEAITAWNTRHRATLSAPVGGWEGIETAPKEGQWIIALIRGSVQPVCWEADPDDDGYFGWCVAGSGFGGVLYSLHNQSDTPTHWRPLPAPPGTPTPQVESDLLAALEAAQKALEWALPLAGRCLDQVESNRAQAGHTGLGRIRSCLYDHEVGDQSHARDALVSVRKARAARGDA